DAHRRVRALRRRADPLRAVDRRPRSHRLGRSLGARRISVGNLSGQFVRPAAALVDRRRLVGPGDVAAGALGILGGPPPRAGQRASNGGPACRVTGAEEMGKKDPRVDAYIDQAGDFAKPILEKLRAAVHSACPDVEEEMKWSFPHFMYKGMLCSMASFKEHAAFGFWKGSLVVGDTSKNAEAMGHLGRLTSLADLPPKTVLGRYIKKAAALND